MMVAFCAGVVVGVVGALVGDSLSNEWWSLRHEGAARKGSPSAPDPPAAASP